VFTDVKWIEGFGELECEPKATRRVPDQSKLDFQPRLPSRKIYVSILSLFAALYTKRKGQFMRITRIILALVASAHFFTANAGPVTATDHQFDPPHPM